MENITFTYEILYKNGHEDEITVDLTEENKDEISQVNEIIQNTFKSDRSGYITLGDGVIKGCTIRLSDVSRVLITVNKNR